MPLRPPRIVLDTNTLLRGLVSRSSPAARVRRGAEQRKFVLLLSKPVLDEYRHVLGDDLLRDRFPELTPELVELTIRRLRFVGDYLRSPRVRFRYPRDPRDEKFIELAVALGATDIISADQDLLSLPTSRSEAGKRFRQRLPDVRVVSAGTFVRDFPSDNLPN